MPVARERASLAERIRTLRRKAGLTQQQLATRAGLALSSISQLESGKTTNPKGRTLARLEKALGVPPGTLAPDEEDY